MSEDNGALLQGREGLRLIVGLMRSSANAAAAPRASGDLDPRPQGMRDLPRGWETILVLQEQPLARDVMGRILEHSGYMVLVARDANEALRLCQTCSRPIHLVIVDGVLKPDHLTLIARLQEQSPRTRFLCVSGYTGAALGELIGPHAFLRKPFSIPNLLRKVREVLDR